MSEVKRWAHAVELEGLQISATYMAINDGGEYVMHDDYDALEAERENLLLSWGLLRSENNALRQQRDKLAGLLERARGCIDAMGWDDLETDIDAALAEINP